MEESLNNPKEDFYDKEIAPALAELAQKCTDQGIMFVAAAEFENGVGKTFSRARPEGADMALITIAAKVRGNLDLLALTLAKSSFAEGHNSLVLQMFTQDEVEK